jgi:glutathione S-transferase
MALPYQTRPVNLAGGELRSPDYLQRNPFGQVPVLDDDGLIIRALPGYVTMPEMWQT